MIHTFVRSKNACSSKMCFFESPRPGLSHISWSDSPKCLFFFLFLVSTGENPLKTTNAMTTRKTVCQDAIDMQTRTAKDASGFREFRDALERKHSLNHRNMECTQVFMSNRRLLRSTFPWHCQLRKILNIYLFGAEGYVRIPAQRKNIFLGWSRSGYLDRRHIATST